MSSCAPLLEPPKKLSQARAFFIWSYKGRNSACESDILLDKHFPVCVNPFWKPSHKRQQFSQARAFLIWSYKWRNSAYESDILLGNHFPVCVNPLWQPPHKTNSFLSQRNQVLRVFLSDNIVCIESSHMLHIYRGNFCLKMPSELTELMINLSFRWYSKFCWHPQWSFWYDTSRPNSLSSQLVCDCLIIRMQMTTNKGQVTMISFPVGHSVQGKSVSVQEHFVLGMLSLPRWGVSFWSFDYLPVLIMVTDF